MNTPLFFYRDVLSLKSNKRSKNVLKSMGTCYNYRINTQEIPVLFHVQLKFNDTPSNHLTSLHSPAHNQSSPSVDPGRTRFQISMVKSVLALLNTDVRELISAAIMAANIRPFKPVVMDTELWLTKLNCAWTFKKLQHFKFMTKNMEITKCTNKSKAKQLKNGIGFASYLHGVRTKWQ